MSFVETDSVAGKEATHEKRKTFRSAAKKKVKMVGGKREGVYGGASLFRKRTQSLKEEFPVCIVPKDRFSLHPSRHDIMDDARCVNSGLSGHCRFSFPA
jgi:hypothetical protein